MSDLTSFRFNLLLGSVRFLSSTFIRSCLEQRELLGNLAKYWNLSEKCSLNKYHHLEHCSTEPGRETLSYDVFFFFFLQHVSVDGIHKLKLTTYLTTW